MRRRSGISRVLRNVKSGWEEKNPAIFFSTVSKLIHLNTLWELGFVEYTAVHNFFSV